MVAFITKLRLFNAIIYIYRCLDMGAAYYFKGVCIIFSNLSLISNTLHYFIFECIDSIVKFNFVIFSFVLKIFLHCLDRIYQGLSELLSNGRILKHLSKLHDWILLLLNRGMIRLQLVKHLLPVLLNSVINLLSQVFHHTINFLINSILLISIAIELGIR